ncbi:hypothetical protein TNCT_102661 [Trichonephila clavata]|uniref:Uncharacterized protein n=1 Tax=Trichonephila clavata TaxID=2740835 RepID=A0A8X6KMC8_TRICU|nr:hypothetical protein TNCT_102661 [Trichonephila clavata]
MLVRLPRAPLLSGGLRRKTQLFSGTLYMAASSKTPPHQSKGPLRSLKPRSKCQFFQGAVCCVVIPVVKKPSDSTSFHSVLVCHRTSPQPKVVLHEPVLIRGYILEKTLLNKSGMHCHLLLQSRL